MRVASTTLLAFVTLAAHACSTPVFQYALERWEADIYEAVVFSSGPLAGEDKKLADALAKDCATCNLTLTLLDANGKLDDEYAKLWQAQGNARLPWLVLRYPTRFEGHQQVWAGPFTRENATALADSPKRKEIVGWFGAGASVVWVLLESGDAEQDRAAAELVERTLKEAEKSITEERAQAEAELEGEEDPRLAAHKPARIAFSTVRLSRSDVQERMLVTLLLQDEAGLQNTRKPAAFPIIGRGRFFDAVTGKEFTAEVLERACAFLCGPCSCEVKEASIGRDLLLAADWDAIVAGEFKDDTLPPAAANPQAPPDVSAPTPQAPAVPPGTLKALHLNVAFVLLTVIALVFFVTAWRTRRVGAFGVVVTLTVIVLGLLTAATYWMPSGQTATAPKSLLVVYCAAGIKPPVEAAAKQYEQEYGVGVHLQYGPSEGLLANIKIAQSGDLYLPGDESYLAEAATSNLVAERVRLAEMRPVIAVRKGNPKRIADTKDFQRDDVRVALASRAAAIGKVTRELLERSGEWPALQKKMETSAATLVEAGTVVEVANNIKLGAVDTGVVWDATVAQYPELEGIVVPLFDPAVQHVCAGVLRCSKQPTTALHFARYLAARDKGAQHFNRLGYKAIDGDPWAEQPEVMLYCDVLLREAVEATLDGFEKREHAQITRVYASSSALAEAVQAGGIPDAYFAGDVAFLKEVQPLFGEALTIASKTDGAATREQALAIGKRCKHPNLVKRLRETLLSAESRARFLAAGFQWKAQ